MAESRIIRPLVAGNWKMNGLRASLEELNALASLTRGNAPACEMLICPPATLIGHAAAALEGSAVAVGAQDCHASQSGAHTGDISADMIKDVGGTHIIVGHSERRADHAETSQSVAAKASAVHSAGLTAIICVGETEAQRDSGEMLRVIEAQLTGSLPAGATADNTVIAYEPVWAIGTGRTPSVQDVSEVHIYIRKRLEALMPTGGAVRILYGGSVKPSNASQLMAASDVNGALVGGASLKATDFNGILDAYRR